MNARHDGVSSEPVCVDALLRPRSLAVVGSLADPHSIGGAFLGNLDRFGYSGELHLVSRNRSQINGRPCVPAIDDLPTDIDSVALVVPEPAVLDAVAGCIRRRAKSALVFAAGFAETGAEGRARQERLAAMAREGGLAVNGPNSIGIINYVDGIPLTFEPLEPQSSGAGRSVAVVAQSGGMSGNIRSAVAAKGIPVSYVISSGNEAVCGIEDFLSYLVDDVETSVIAAFVEQVRRPHLFRQLIRRAQARGKPVVLMHPGRSARARESAQSHTGALAGDYAVMRTLLDGEGVLIVDTLDELVDVTTLLCRNPEPPALGPAIVTNSGAFRGIALDFCDDLGLTLPTLSDATTGALRHVLPNFAAFDNPVDVTTAGMTNPGVFGDTARLLLDDPGTGSLLVTIMGGAPRQQVGKVSSLLPVMTATAKPVALVILGDDLPLSEEALALVRESGVPFFRSPDRALRALARITAHGQARQAASAAPPLAMPALCALTPGTVPEYRSKLFLAAAGLTVPFGALVQSADEAAAIAAAIGYPVVLKAQAAELPHKTEAGGVALGIADEPALRRAWSQMTETLQAARPGLVLDGVLVEPMAAGGLEMIIGARRDPDWGPVLMVGLGGIWAEALKDVRLLPAEAGPDRIAAELGRLRGAALLDGFRGSPPVDRPALIDALMRLAALVRSHPEIEEIEINPLIVYPQGKGTVALDALMVVAPEPVTTQRQQNIAEPPY
jgi:acyl-CoA synthetase (NDP forming)